ncbi:hypothetical protein VNO78_26453 [Psophocarpus tetragonolobus]|uniref:Uncharacterized protein n=1 Tax=Psophocarpus tetragonolobus TaxID=3891 RepID=A0AAN9XAQ3_PSOTE
MVGVVGIRGDMGKGFEDKSGRCDRGASQRCGKWKNSIRTFSVMELYNSAGNFRPFLNDKDAMKLANYALNHKYEVGIFVEHRRSYARTMPMWLNRVSKFMLMKVCLMLVVVNACQIGDMKVFLIMLFVKKE